MHNRIPILAGITSASIGFLALLGWTFEIEKLTSLIPGRIAMNPATAIGLILLGASLAVCSREPDSARRRIAVLLAALAGAIGILRLGGYLFDFDPLVDRLLFPASIGENRIAPNTAFSFMLLSVSCILISLSGNRGHRIAITLTLAASFLSFLTLVGHLYGATFLYTLSGFIGMSIPTAIAFIILCLGLLFTRPDHGPAAILLSRLPGGEMARKLVPVALLLPVVLGYLRVLGQEAGLYGTQFGLALLVAAIVAFLTGVILKVASSIDRTSAERDRIFNLSSDLICIAGADGLFKSVNPAWTRTLGYSPEEMEGKPFLSFIHPDDRVSTETMAAAQAKGESAVDFENRYRAKDGSWRNLLWMATPVQENNCIYAIARDITRRKESEVERERLVAELASANSELEGFSYSVSHDLRAPLRAIDGFSRILLEEYSPKLDDEGKRLLGIVRENTIRMSQLIQDLLTFSRLGRKSLEFERVEMTPVVRRIVDDLRGAEPARAIKITIENLPDASADPAMIRQVWINLLSNAFKYTRNQQHPEIHVSGEARDGGVRYEVRDNGSGFDMRYSDKLFGVFQRLHSQQEFEGTGIGLALVKRIVTKHGGSIEADAEPGRGATFRFRLPVKKGEN